MNAKMGNISRYLLWALAIACTASLIALPAAGAIGPTNSSRASRLIDFGPPYGIVSFPPGTTDEKIVSAYDALLQSSSRQSTNPAQNTIVPVAQDSSRHGRGESSAHYSGGGQMHTKTSDSILDTPPKTLLIVGAIQFGLGLVLMTLAIYFKARGFFQGLLAIFVIWLCGPLPGILACICAWPVARLLRSHKKEEQTPDLYTEITKLDELRKKGVLTKKEFAARKKRLLESR